MDTDFTGGNRANGKRQVCRGLTQRRKDAKTQNRGVFGKNLAKAGINRKEHGVASRDKALNHGWTRMDTDLLQEGTEPTEGEQDGHEKARKDTKTEWKNFIAACEQVGLLLCKDHKEICWFYTLYPPLHVLKRGFAIGSRISDL
jgi:hypothetical protein